MAYLSFIRDGRVGDGDAQCATVQEAAGITLIGAADSIPCPWSGGNGTAERSIMVAGSIVTLNQG